MRTTSRSVAPRRMAGRAWRMLSDASFDLTTSVPDGTETANASTDSRNVAGRCWGTARPPARSRGTRWTRRRRQSPAARRTRRGTLPTSRSVAPRRTAGRAWRMLVMPAFDLDQRPAGTEDGQRVDQPARRARRRGQSRHACRPDRGEQGGQEGPGGRLRRGGWSLARVQCLDRLQRDRRRLRPGERGRCQLHSLDHRGGRGPRRATHPTGSRTSRTCREQRDRRPRSAGNKIDKKGPTVALTCPASPILLNAPVSANWTASDGGSVVAIGFASGSFSVPTNSVGQQVATAAAGVSHDNVGNPSSASAPCAYGVEFAFSGFRTPVDNNGVLNGGQLGPGHPAEVGAAGLCRQPGHHAEAASTVTVTALACSAGVDCRPDRGVRRRLFRSPESRWRLLPVQLEDAGQLCQGPARR